MIRSALAAGAMALATAVQAGAPVCSARSPAHTVALVELYTSEGCSSCPPADHWLSSLSGQGFSPKQVVPLALHVDYWDYIGWKDRFAKTEFSARQQRLALLKRPTFVYTPQVLLQGKDFRHWGSPEFADTVARINARPASAQITLAIDALTPGAIQASLGARLSDSAGKNAVAYLAAYENRLASEVRSGENRGRRLQHDYVVREWIGPISFGGNARLEEKRVLPLLPGTDPKHLGVAAFVQDRSTGDVLQALMLPACPG